ncbi:hypothetical protein Tco_0907440 [Tanacetum coccineum]|uniref:Uncharacterized protein n=1 Tax=Tanacetum coccineum TaxID=301880 RepID=A0ABQ5CJC7_9ASTR
MLGEMWDCQLGNLTAGKVSGGGGRQALQEDTQLPQTSVPIPNVADEAIFKEWDDRVVWATITVDSLDAAQASGAKKPWGGGSITQTRSEKVPTSPYDSPLPRVNTLRSDEGSMTLLELTVLCTTLSKKVESLEADLKQTKKDSSQEYQPEDQLGVFSAAKVLADAAKKNVNTYTRRRRAISTGSGEVSTASRLFSTVEESVSIVGASMPVSTAGMVQEVNISFPSPVVVKDKGKGIMTDSEDEQTKRTKLQQEQDRLGHKATVRLQEELQEELDKEERQRMARVHATAQSFTKEEWENIRARVEADEELTQRLQARERKEVTVQLNQHRACSTVELYYKLHQVHGNSYTQQLKRYSFDELKELFETTMKNVNTFVSMETEDRGRASELAAGSLQAQITDFAEVGSSKRGAELGLDHEGSKKQKTNEASVLVQEQPDEEEKELP